MYRTLLATCGFENFRCFDLLHFKYQIPLSHTSNVWYIALQ